MTFSSLIDLEEVFLPMKVCMFVFDNCQHDARVLKEAKTLADAGFDVRIIAKLDESTIPFEQRDGFKIIRLDYTFIDVRIIKVVVKAVLILTAIVLLPFLLIVWPSKRGRNILRSFKPLRPLRPYLSGRLISIRRPIRLFEFCYRSWKTVKDEAADVYHCHDLGTLLIGWFARRRTGGRLVYDAHELFTELGTIGYMERQYYRLLERHLIHRVDAVIVPGNSRGQYLSKRYGIQLPTSICNFPPSYGRYMCAITIREKLGLAGNTPIIVYTGGYIPGRGLHNLVSSATYLDKGVLVFIGWGVLEEKLKSMVKEKGLEKKVIFTEPVPPNELVSFIRSANLGVVIYQYTSLNNYYACPNKLYEYIHAGLPVVSSNFPGLREIVDGYQLGKTFDPEDPKDIADATNQTLRDEKRYNELKRNALEAARVFNWENESGKLLALYEGLRLQVL
jgi:glycosyltransferase involved in cell wall biosynthesis